MTSIRSLKRLFALWRIATRHDLDALLFAAPRLRRLRSLRLLAPLRFLSPRRRAAAATRGARIRCALEEAGPIFVKLGQMVSTRRDLLPDDIADELAKLQDAVPPFPGAQARAAVEEALGEPLERLFRRFDETPLASASIAQVHLALLPDGREAAVKVVRPGIEARIVADLALAARLAAVAARLWPTLRRLRLPALIADYREVILDELDMRREAANLCRMRRNFAADRDAATGGAEAETRGALLLPTVEWSLTRAAVLTMGRVSGVPVSDVDALRRRQVDLQRLAALGVEIFFTQVFRDNFFHADMHPGNIFVDATDPRRPRYIAVDFGIVGILAERDRRYLAESFLAFFNRDFRRLARLHIDAGWVDAGVRMETLEGAFRALGEPLFERPLRELSYARLLVDLFRVGGRFGMEVQPQLALLQKTLVYVEGLGKRLYPELDLWSTAKPFLQRWLEENSGWRRLRAQCEEHAPRLLEQLPALPGLLHDTLEQARAGRLAVHWKGRELEALRGEIRAARGALWGAVAGAALLIAGLLLDAPSWGGWLLMAAGGALLWRARPR